jgi:hypothetical protein
VERAVGALLSAMERGEGLGRPILDAWSSGCRRLLGGISSASGGRSPALRVELRSFLASLLHMHNNRLGLSIPEEVQLAHLAARALAQQEVMAP